MHDIQEKSERNRCGFVAVVGKPNTGKSTLMNAILHQRIASVSPWPQTTRRRQLGIVTLPEAQAVFMDTPGLHQPKNKLGRSMLKIAEETIAEADVILFLADLKSPPDEEDRTLLAWVKSVNKRAPILLVLNKDDAISGEERSGRLVAYQALSRDLVLSVISALRGDGLAELFEAIVSLLPFGPMLFPEEDVTDLSEREISEDLIHESALRHLRDEVPHGVAVRVERYQEREENGSYIEATLYVEKESHKPIVIGKGGSMLKKIGTEARKKIEEMSGRKVFLDIHVKVLPRWRDNESALRRLGFRLPAE